MMKRLSSSETSVLARGTQLNVPEDAILHSHPVDGGARFLRNFGYYKRHTA
jgi:hypothetical protein